MLAANTNGPGFCQLLNNLHTCKSRMARCYTQFRMTEEKDSLLDRAESFARRLLERVGARVDDRASSSDDRTLTPKEVGEITSKIEKAIETSLRDDKNGVRRVAPNIFKILFPYETATRLNSSYVSALAQELQGTVYEYITNRRYETRGTIRVSTGQDLFAKSVVINSFFEGEETSMSQSRTGDSNQASSMEGATRAISFASEDGQVFNVALKSGEGPVYIGRAAGVVLRIEDSSISRLHCSLTLRKDGEVIISDLGSSNGTTVNGHLLNRDQGRAIKQGDSIIVGDISLRVVNIG